MEVPRSIRSFQADTTAVTRNQGVATTKPAEAVDATTKEAAPVAIENDAVKTTGTEKGALPADAVKFDEPKPEAEKATQANGLFDGKPALSFTLEDPKYPTVEVSEWKGYNKDVNTSVAQAFDEKSPVGEKTPVIGQKKVSALLAAFGATKVSDFQTTIGAKQDDKFGAETYFKTKTHVSGQINQVQSIEEMGKISKLLGLFGKDPQVDQMKTILSEKMKVAQDYASTKEGLSNFVSSINNVLAKTNPKDLNSLNDAKTKLGETFGKLPENIKNHPQAAQANTEAIARVDGAINALKSDTDKSKQAYGNEVNCIADEAVNAAFVSGDKSKLDEGKTKINDLDKIFESIKDSPEAKTAKDQGIAKLDDAGKKIDQVKSLSGKKEWSADETKTAQDLAKSLPDGDFKTGFNKSIDSHIASAKLKEENRANLKTTKAGLSDVIGNGFWNLENKEGTKSMFQLIAKQGLLGEAMTKMNFADQTKAINILSKDVNFDKPSDTDKFNLDIAKTMYQNLSKAIDIDAEIDKKALPQLKKDVSADFDNHKIDSQDYLKGMKFSIGADRLGSEKEAALTMARAVMHGEVPKETISSLSRYELSDITKYIEKNGNKDEKSQFLSTIASTYNSGTSVNIESLSKGDKAQVIKNVMDTNSDQAKVSDLLKKAGKSVVIETVKSQNLSDLQLSIVGKNVSGNDMADSPDAASKILTGMIRTYDKQETNSPIKLEDIKKFVDQISKNTWNNNHSNTMTAVVNTLGDGPDSDYAKFQRLSPRTLDNMRDISRSKNNSSYSND